MTTCRYCPWNCGVDRSRTPGRCGGGVLPKVARASLHHWEEPCISGDRGSGAIFFSHCNLNCVYCQNHTISHGGFGKEISIDALSDLMISLQRKGAHNINLVSGSHYIPQIRDAIIYAKEKGLTLPIILNSNGYDSPSGLSMLEGLIDIYLPDVKYYDDDLAERYSGAKDYFRTASKAVKIMLGQVGPPIFDEKGLLLKGLIIRHLILPGHLENTKDVLDWIRISLPKEIYVSVMSQYFPTYKSSSYGTLARKLSGSEYAEIMEYLEIIGLENGFVQEPESAAEEYVPSFDLAGIE